MTLITRIIRENDVIIAADNQLNDDNGYPLYDPKTSKPQFIQKGVAFFIQKGACGVSGFIGKDDYSVISHLSEISTDSEFLDINDLIEEIADHLNEESNPIDEIVVLATGYSDGEQCNLALVKEKKHKQFAITNRKVPPCLFHTMHAQWICSHFDFDYNNLKEEFNTDDFSDKIDFNFNYASENADYNKASCIPYTYLYLFLFKEYNSTSLAILNEFNDQEIEGMIIGYYKFLDYVNQEIHEKKFRNENPMLRTIGECGGIIKVSEKTSEWLYRYDS